MNSKECSSIKSTYDVHAPKKLALRLLNNLSQDNDDKSDKGIRSDELKIDRMPWSQKALWNVLPGLLTCWQWIR